MSFTNPPPSDHRAPTLRDWIGTPVIGYHSIDGITFKPYSPVMPMPLPTYGGYHPRANVTKTNSPVGQNMYSLYGNPSSQYYQNTVGQR